MMTIPGAANSYIFPVPLFLAWRVARAEVVAGVEMGRGVLLEWGDLSGSSLGSIRFGPSCLVLQCSKDVLSTLAQRPGGTASTWGGMRMESWRKERPG